jgi:hypothetical protein
MRAVRFHGQKDIRVEEIEEPVIEKGKVKVRCLRMPGSFNTVLPSFLPSFLPNRLSDQTRLRWDMWLWSASTLTPLTPSIPSNPPNRHSPHRSPRIPWRCQPNPHNPPPHHRGGRSHNARPRVQRHSRGGRRRRHRFQGGRPRVRAAHHIRRHVRRLRGERAQLLLQRGVYRTEWYIWISPSACLGVTSEGLCMEPCRMGRWTI